MSKFAVGEIAIIVGKGMIGPMECEIIQTPLPHESWFGREFLPAGRYVILVPGHPSHVDGGYWNCVESKLRKRPQRGLPDSVTTIFKQPRAVEA